jgi:hypothetical protein
MTRAHRSQGGRIADGLLAGLFAALLLLPAADDWLHLDPVPARGELRRLGAWDDVEAALGTPAALPAALRAYAADHFGFRNALIRLHARLTVLGLGVSSTDKVVLGKEGWAFLRSERAVESYRAADPFPPAELGHLLDVLETRRRWLEEQGIRYLVVVAPNKHTVYADHLPDTVVRVGPRTRLDELADALAERTRVPLLDLRPVLADAAGRDVVYDPLGTHWNALGAFHAYRAITLRLRDWFPELRPLVLEDFRVHSRPGGDMGLASMLGLEGVLAQQTLALAPRFERRAVDLKLGLPFHKVPKRGFRPSYASGAPGLTGPRVVLLRDSFGSQLWPFFAETFPRVFYLWPASLTVREVDRRVIAREHPDVVIRLFAERRLQEPMGALRAFGGETERSVIRSDVPGGEP